MSTTRAVRDANEAPQRAVRSTQSQPQATAGEHVLRFARLAGNRALLASGLATARRPTRPLVPLPALRRLALAGGVVQRVNGDKAKATATHGDNSADGQSGDQARPNLSARAPGLHQHIAAQSFEARGKEGNTYTRRGTVCAEVAAIDGLLGKLAGAGPLSRQDLEAITITRTQQGDYVLLPPCANCSTWLEVNGHVFTIKPERLPPAPQPPVPKWNDDSAFPALRK